MRIIPEAKLLASGCGKTPSPFRMTHTAAYSIHSFIAYPSSLEFAAGRQYARGPSLEDSGSMLDSPFRDRNYRSHRRKAPLQDRKSTRLNSSHSQISYAAF